MEKSLGRPYWREAFPVIVVPPAFHSSSWRETAAAARALQLAPQSRTSPTSTPAQMQIQPAPPPPPPPHARHFQSGAQAVALRAGSQSFAAVAPSSWASFSPAGGSGSCKGQPFLAYGAARARRVRRSQKFPTLSPRAENLFLGGQRACRRAIRPAPPRLALHRCVPRQSTRSGTCAPSHLCRGR